KVFLWWRASLDLSNDLLSPRFVRGADENRNRRPFQTAQSRNANPAKRLLHELRMVFVAPGPSHGGSGRSVPVFRQGSPHGGFLRAEGYGLSVQHYFSRFFLKQSFQDGLRGGNILILDTHGKSEPSFRVNTQHVRRISVKNVARDRSRADFDAFQFIQQ